MIKHELRHHQPKLVRVKPHQSPPLLFHFYKASFGLHTGFCSSAVSQHYGDEEKATAAFSFFLLLFTRPPERDSPAGIIRSDRPFGNSDRTCRLQRDQKPHCFSRPAHSCASQGASVFSISPLSQAAAMEGSMGRRETEGMPCFSAIFSIWLSPKML